MARSAEEEDRRCRKLWKRERVRREREWGRAQVGRREGERHWRESASLHRMHEIDGREENSEKHLSCACESEEARGEKISPSHTRACKRGGKELTHHKKFPSREKEKEGGEKKRKKKSLSSSP